MAYSYTPANISRDNTDTVSAVRWLIQDMPVTVDGAATAEIADSEILALYAQTQEADDQTARNLATAVLCAQALERRYRKQATFTTSGTTIQYTERARAWAQVASDLASEWTAYIGLSAISTGRRPIPELQWMR